MSKHTTQVRLTETAYELAKKSAKHDGKSLTEWLCAAVESHAKSDRKLRHIAWQISKIRGLLLGKSVEDKKTAAKMQSDDESTELEPKEDDGREKLSDDLAAVRGRYFEAYKAGDMETAERLRSEAKEIKAKLDAYKP